MQFKNLLLVLLAISVFSACDDKQNKFNVVAQVNGFPGSYVYLEDISTDDIIIVDSAKPSADGKFEVSSITTEPSLFRLRFSPRDFILLSVEKGNININADWGNLSNYTIKGSEATESIRQMIANMRNYFNQMNQVKVQMDAAFKAEDQVALQELDGNMKALNQDLTRYVEQYADTVSYAPNAVFAAKMLPTAQQEFLDAFIPNLKKRFPESKMAAAYIETQEEKLRLAKAQEMKDAHLAIGKQAPEIALPTVDGDTVALSSLRGKYVLVDYWASWCGPCRRENPNVVAAYQKFKNKNFTILGVSLDEDADKWQAAIEKDQLTWAHISDLKGWQSIAARDYNINGIPFNFLVDPDGRIMAKNLRGPGLHDKLAEVLQ